MVRHWLMCLFFPPVELELTELKHIAINVVEAIKRIATITKVVAKFLDKCIFLFS